jgi:glycosyltransferase involved in cell wall biosynthesis
MKSEAFAAERSMQDNRIRVVKFITNFYIGGTERQFVQIIRNLDLARFDLHLGCFRRDGSLLPFVESKNIPLHEYRIRRLYSPATWLRICEFARFLRRNRVQIVHSYGFYPNSFALPAARLAGVPVTIASIRDTGDVLAPRKRRVQGMICRLATCVLANADAVGHQLIKDGYNAEKVAVIRNGITLQPLERRAEGGPLRKELGFPANAPIVAVLSRLNDLKGITYLLDAIPSVLAQCPDARFLIVGDGPRRRDFEAYAERNGYRDRAIFTGFRLDVPEILKEISVSVLPSLSEGLSNTLIESMAAGVPVIATRVGGNPEIVEDGVTGLLAPPRDVGALAHAITMLLQNPERAEIMGKAGRDRIARAFSLDRAIDETQRLYVSLLEHSDARARS